VSFEYQEGVAEYFLTKWRGKPCQYIKNCKKLELGCIAHN
jgi:hypothetical protein